MTFSGGTTMRFLRVFLLAFLLSAALFAQDPGDAELMNGLGAFGRGEVETAYQEFEKAADANSSLAPAGVLTAILFTRQGDAVRTREFLNRAVAASPHDPEAWYRLAQLAADEHRVPELTLLLEKADSLLKNFTASNAVSRVDFLKGESLSLAARLAQEQGDLPKAESKMREYLALNPESGEGELSLGFLLLEQKKTDEAIQEFDRAKERNSEYCAGWLTAALLLDEAGRGETALQLLKDHSGGELTPVELDRAARLFFRHGQLEDARSLVNRIPEKTLDRCRWDGLLAYTAEEYEDAEKYYREAAALAPNDFDAVSGLILALAEQGKESLFTEAFERADKLRRKHPQSDEAAGTLAWVEFRRGNLGRGEDILLPILDRGGLTPTSAYYLACMSVYSKETDLARQLLENALDGTEFFPKRADAEKLRAELAKKEE